MFSAAWERNQRECGTCFSFLYMDSVKINLPLLKDKNSRLSGVYIILESRWVTPLSVSIEADEHQKVQDRKVLGTQYSGKSAST